MMNIAEEPAHAAPRPAAVPYLAVDDARRAIDWYVDIFGAEVSGEPIVMSDDRIGHAELTISGGVLYLADAFPEIGVTAPRAGEAPVSLMLPVHDADEVRTRAMAAGASGDRPPYDAYGTRNAWIVDPFGHRWGLNSPLPTPAATAFRHGDGRQAGDLAYLTFEVVDSGRARAFYGAVLDWQFMPGRVADGWQVADTVPMIGISGGHRRATVVPMWRVDDIAAAVAAVRAQGGTATEPQRQPYGTTSECVDDQGSRFHVGEM